MHAAVLLVLLHRHNKAKEIIRTHYEDYSSISFDTSKCPKEEEKNIYDEVFGRVFIPLRELNSSINNR